MKSYIIKLTILIAIIGALFLFYRQGWHKELNFGKLKENKDQLLQYAEANYFKTVLLFIFIYSVVTAISIPSGATILTLAAGSLFGTILGALYVNVGATAGSVVVFVVARYLLGNWLQDKYSEKLEKFNKELSERGHNYLLSLRFIPAVPFFLLNILAGLTSVSLWTYTWTTALGIVPGSLVYTYTGKQLGNISSTKDIVSHQMILVFILLGLFSITPIIVGYYRKKARGDKTEGARS